MADGSESTYEGWCRICEKGMDTYEGLIVPDPDVPLPEREYKTTYVHRRCYIELLEGVAK